MKMKKLLAGVLSAAMVATMIPASMAFSGVSAQGGSAEAVDAAQVASYDFTSSTGTGTLENATWTATSNGTTIGDPAADETGVHLSDGWYTDYQRYSVANPLRNSAENGFTVVLDVTVTGSNRNAYESMFGFLGADTSENAFYAIQSNGSAVRYNDYYNNNTAANYYDVENETIVDMSSSSQYVVAVVANTVSIYCNNSLVTSFTATVNAATGDNAHDVLESDDFVSGMTNFVLGCVTPWWGQVGMTVRSVEFYNTALSADDVTYLYTGNYPSVSYAALNAAIAEAEDLNPLVYSEDSYAVVTSALEAARAALSSDNQNEVDSAAADLNTAIENLVIVYGLIDSSDFTTAEGNVGWTAYSDKEWQTASSTNVVYEEGTGITLSTDPSWVNSYSTANPLKGGVNQGFTISMNVMVPSSDQGIYNGLVGFSNHEVGTYFGMTNNGTTVRYNSDGYFDLGVPSGNNVVGTALDLSEMANYVVTADGDSMEIYLNGVLQCTYTTSDTYDGTKALAYANSAEYVNLGYFCSQAGWAWNNSLMTVEDIAFYNTALTANEVAENYAQSIADSLNLVVAGMQDGTLASGEAGTRFVARLNRDALEAAGTSVLNLGWAYDAASTTLADYGTTPITKVTYDSAVATDTTYAYTIAFEGTAADNAVAPYVTIQVGENTYNFCYNGRYGQYGDTSTAAQIVYAPVEFSVSSL